MAEKQGTAYEKFVREVFALMGALEGVADNQVIHDARIVGKAGVPNQIDVYWEFTRIGERYRTVVECKQKGRPVGQEVVKEVSTTVDDLGPGTTGIIVSWSGFTRGAKAFATANRIKLMEVHPVLKRVDIALTFTTAPEIVAVHLKFDPADEQRALRESGVAPGSLALSANEVDEVFNDGSGAKRSIRALLGKRRGTAGTHAVECAGLSVDTGIGPILVSELAVTLVESEQLDETNVIVVETGDAARALVKNVLRGHAVYVHDDGTTIQSRRGGRRRWAKLGSGTRPRTTGAPSPSWRRGRDGAPGGVARVPGRPVPLHRRDQGGPRPRGPAPQAGGRPRDPTARAGEHLRGRHKLTP